MVLDVRGDRRVKHVRAWIARLKALAEIRRGNVFVDGVQQMNAASLGRRKAQRRQVRQRKARAAHHDPFRNFKQPLRLVPTRKVEEAVCANEVEESRLRNRLLQRSQRLNGVVRCAVAPGRIEIRNSKARVRSTGKFHHREPVVKACGNALLFQRLAPHRGKKNAVQIEYVCSSHCNGDMAMVRWIEATAEEGYAHGNSLADRTCIAMEGGRRNPC